VFAKRTQISSNSTVNVKISPETPNVPNFNEFDWKLCKVGEYCKHFDELSLMVGKLI